MTCSFKSHYKLNKIITEAEMIKDILQTKYKINEKQILCEKNALNKLENFHYIFKMLYRYKFCYEINFDQTDKSIRNKSNSEIDGLILSQFFHKLKNIAKFYKEFIPDIIERIKLKMSPFCHFCDQKRDVNVILIYCI